MDYSNMPNEPSPWQTSPAPNRSSFERPDQASGPVASSPGQGRSSMEQAVSEPSYQGPQVSEEAPEETIETSNGKNSPNVINQTRQNSTGKGPTRPVGSTVPDIRFQDEPLTEEELRQKQLQQQRQQERYQQAIHAQQHQRGPGPNRYHQSGRQGQKPPPQYKLQAKITGLERTGKKDPAIRFDVHVSRIE